MITKDMADPNSRWRKVRDEFEKLYDQHTKDYFLDAITTAFIVKEVEPFDVAKFKWERQEAKGGVPLV